MYNESIKDLQGLLNMNTEFLKQLHDALGAVLVGGNGDGLGFCDVPQNQNQVKYLFPGYDEAGMGKPPYLFALGENNVHIPIPKPALKGKLKFLNLIDTTTGGVDKQKLEFWIDCGGKTYVIYLGWSDPYGKLNNATESFLKALASFSKDEILEPFTFTFSRLVDKPSYDPSKGNAATAGKVLLVDVWKNDGSPVYYEHGHMDAANACGVITRINELLTGQLTLTPRQPKPKNNPAPAPVTPPATLPPQANTQQWSAPTPVTPPPAPPVINGMSAADQKAFEDFKAFQAQQAQQTPQQPQWAAPVPATPPPAPPVVNNGNAAHWM